MRAKNRRHIEASQGVTKVIIIASTPSFNRSSRGPFLGQDLFEEPSETAADIIDRQFLSLIDDIVPAFFEHNPTRFLKASCIPVRGTNHSLITFKLDTVVLDAEIRAAFRARGFELSDGDNVIASQFRSPS
jgi:hypothetical protein